MSADLFTTELVIAESLDFRLRLSIEDAAEHTHSHRNTISKWIHKKRGIALEACRFGGRIYTTKPAIERFISRCSSPEPCNANPVCYPTTNAGASRRLKKKLADPSNRKKRNKALRAKRRSNEIQ